MTNAFIYDAVRTPRGRGKQDGALHEVTALNLASQALTAIKSRNNLDTALVDDVVMGVVDPVGEAAHQDAARPEADHGGDGGEAHVALGAGHAEADVQRRGAGVEDQRHVEQVRFVEQIAVLHHVQKRHEQQEGDAQSYQHRWAMLESAEHSIDLVSFSMMRDGSTRRLDGSDRAPAADRLSKPLGGSMIVILWQYARPPVSREKQAV